MKILITSDWYKPQINGVVTSILNLEKGLKALGHDVRILTLSQNIRYHKTGNVTYLSSLNADPIYPGARIVRVLVQAEIEDIIEWKPDIIHSQCEFSTFQVALKIADKTKAPIVHTYHTCYEDYTQYVHFLSHIGRGIIASMSRQIVSQTRCVIVPTHKVKTILERYRVNRPIAVIPTGLDLDPFLDSVDAMRITQLKETLHIPRHHKVLLYLGRIAQEKHIDEIIDNVKRMNRDDLTFVIVGGGPYLPKLQSKVIRLGMTNQVIFTGMVNPQEVPLYYRIGDIFTSASTSETQGLTYIEALASGLPAVCKKDPCLEGVILSGINGYQFETYEEFFSHLTELLDDCEKRRAFSSQAQKIMCENFGYVQFAKRAEEVYKKALSSPPDTTRLLSRAELYFIMDKLRTRLLASLKKFHSRAEMLKDGMGTLVENDWRMIDWRKKWEDYKTK
jgi:1,2-diacylglycerol 3-alpha-glucosyltransferase